MGGERCIQVLMGGNLRERDHMEDPGCGWKDNFKMGLNEVG
jgi:hypothetical protein